MKYHKNCITTNLYDKITRQTSRRLLYFSLILSLLFSSVFGNPIYAAAPPEETVSPDAATVLVNITQTSVAITRKQSQNLSYTFPTGTTYSLTWTSSNPSVATVSSTGRITGVSAGTTTITVEAYYPYSSQQLIVKTDTCTVTVTPSVYFPNATYFIENVATEKYFDIEGPSKVDGAVIQQWQLSGGNSRKWELQLQSDGYYTIKSVYSGKFLSIDSNYTSVSGAKLLQYTSNSSHLARWSIVPTAIAGQYKIVPKSLGGGSYVIALPSTTSGNGVDLQMSAYTNNTSYQDEWKLSRMLPLSGSEIEYGTSGDWSTSYIGVTNCYTYAVNSHIYAQYTYGNTIIAAPINPGMLSDVSIDSYTTTPTVLYTAAKADAAKVSPQYIFEPIEPYETCPAGSYKIALFVDGDDNITDYHWYRQDSDGLWSHKRGTTEVIRTDNSNKLIIDPRYANTNYGYQEWVNPSTGETETGYLVYEFVGFYAVTPWDDFTASTATIAHPTQVSQVSFLTASYFSNITLSDPVEIIN